MRHVWCGSGGGGGGGKRRRAELQRTGGPHRSNLTLHMIPSTDEGGFGSRLKSLPPPPPLPLGMTPPFSKGTAAATRSVGIPGRGFDERR